MTRERVISPFAQAKPFIKKAPTSRSFFLFFLQSKKLFRQGFRLGIGKSGVDAAAHSGRAAQSVEIIGKLLAAFGDGDPLALFLASKAKLVKRRFHALPDGGRGVLSPLNGGGNLFKNKGVSDAEIDAALSALPAEQEEMAAQELLKKYMRGKVCDKATLQKACRYLLGKGYDYEVVKSALSAYGECEEE